MLKNFETRVEVSGHGTSKQHAVAAALAGVQHAVGRQRKDVLLVRIQPQDITVTEAWEIRKIEKFLFFFFPRERKRYTVRLKVSVSVSMIDIANIEFKTAID